MSDFCATPQESLTLDVGCGASPKGDVNVDLCPFDRSQCADEWSPKATKNFVLADASHLPFKSGCFGIVYASHVLEHVPNPLSALEEWRRVCCGRVIVWIPSQYIDDKSKAHLYSWNKITLKNLMEKVFSKVH